MKLSRKEANEKSKALTYGDISKIMCKGDIQLADIATPGKDGVLPKFVLVVGAPGVGKSTFAWKACRKWAKGKILQHFELVILVRLRDLSVRRATCLGDLIQYPRDPTICHMVIEEITKTGGKGVLLLLEGYDELPATLREEESLFRNIIQGNLFDEGTVVVTSRHWASEPFLLPHYDTKRSISKHIEILGFNRKNIQDYLELMLKEEPSLLLHITQYLELCPHIHSMMYIPLNCAIILEVFKNSAKENSPIPTTMTELYSSLIRSLLLRHIYDLPEYKDKCVKLINLSHLPECIKSHFDNLAKLAYESICNNDQRIIFTEDEIPGGLNTLGLMQSSMELYVDIGSEKSFNFLHLTIQEFLAAYHLLTFSFDEQVEIFLSTKNTKSVLLWFLAGLSPLALESAISHHTHTQSVTLESIHQLFEAIKIKVHRKCLTFDEYTYNPFGESHPYHYYMLGSVIANTGKSCRWDVSIYNTKCIKMFVNGIISCKDENLQCMLSLHISVDSHSDRLLELCSVPITLEDLELIGRHTLRDDVISDSLCPFFDALSGGSQLIIKHLQFTGIGFNPEVSEKIEFYLMNTSRITSLTIKCSYFCRELYSQREALVFVMMLKEFKTLHVGSIIGFTQSVVELLGANDTLKSLVLELERERAGSINFSLREDGNRWQIEEASSITTLSLPLYNEVDSSWKFKIAGLIIEAHNAEEFATILRNKTALKELHVLGCIRIFYMYSERTIIFSTTSSSLTHNSSLLKFAINNIFYIYTRLLDSLGACYILYYIF